jgi:hypothetical protein
LEEKKRRSGLGKDIMVHKSFDRASEDEKSERSSMILSVKDAPFGVFSFWSSISDIPEDGGIKMFMRTHAKKDVSKKKFWITLIAIIPVLACLFTVLYFMLREDIPEYGGYAGIQVDDSAMSKPLSGEDIRKVHNLVTKVAKALYDGGYSQEEIDNIMTDTSADEIEAMSDGLDIKSTVLSADILDIKMKDDERGNALVCCLLDFESKTVEPGRYYFFADLEILKAEDTWFCENINIKHYAKESEYIVTRGAKDGLVTVQER